VTQEQPILWGEEILRAGHTLRMAAEGISMFPWIRHGDIVTIRPTRASEIMVGDVVVRRAGQKLVAHRLIARKWSGGLPVLVVKGDFVSTPDRLMLPCQLLGRVVSIERRSRIIRLDTPQRRFFNWSLAVLSTWFHLDRMVAALQRTRDWMRAVASR
jgi:signal peptidase I